MQRIAIIGVTGSGKTTLGNKLSAKLAIQLTDLDDIHWQPGWKERDAAETRQLVDEATQKLAWITTGNYSHIQDILWPRADTLIWLDYSFLLVLRRLLKRSVTRVIDRQAVCNGNYETFAILFSKDSIVLWLFKSFRRIRHRYGGVFSHPEQYPHIKLIRFKTPEETELWLEKF